MYPRTNLGHNTNDKHTHTHTHRKSLIFEMIKSITQQPVPIVTFQLLFKSIVIQTYEASKDRPVFYISFIRKSFRNTGTLKKKKEKRKTIPVAYKRIVFKNDHRQFFEDRQSDDSRKRAFNIFVVRCYEHRISIEEPSRISRTSDTPGTEEPRKLRGRIRSRRDR